MAIVIDVRGSVPHSIIHT